MKYEVTIAETWTKTITIEADSSSEADAKALELYHDEVGVLEHEGIALDLDAKRSSVSIANVQEVS